MLCRHYLPSCAFGIVKNGGISSPINYERISLNIDGAGTIGMVNLDIVKTSIPSKKSIILIPGVTGDSQDNYVLDLVH